MELDNYSVSIIIPCYNEESGICSTIKSLVRAMEDIENYEIIIVNDGSTDQTLEKLFAISNEYKNIKILNHERNKGYGSALKTGIRHASSELIAITDADGTYPNEFLPKLIKEAEFEDMIVGARILKNEVEYPMIRKIPKLFLANYASWIAGTKIIDMNSGMRVFRKKIAEKFINILPNGFSFTTTITIAMMTNYYRVKYIPIGYKNRIGKSKIRPIYDTLNFVQLIVRTGIYFAPLRVFSPIIIMLSILFIISFLTDFMSGNFTDKTLIILMFTLNTGLFALLADMIDKRSS